MTLAEKIERKVYVNQEDLASHIQPPSWIINDYTISVGIFVGCWPWSIKEHT